MAHGHVRRESVETEMHKSEDKAKTFVYTKKRGYDVTRNPYLNKVSGLGGLGGFPAGFNKRRLTSQLMRSGGIGNYNTAERDSRY